MRKYFLFFLTLISLKNYSSIDIEKDKNKNRILPFSRLKMIGDEIFFCLSMKEDNWYKLLSFESIGSDALVRHSVLHFGRLKCDYNIECYKYNIISNFDKVFYSLIAENIPKHCSLEYIKDNSSMKEVLGLDVESSFEKFQMNQDNLELNIKESIDSNLLYNNISPLISKGINKIKKAFGNFFGNEKNEIKFDNTKFNDNLRKELKEVKEQLIKIEKNEKNMKSSIESLNYKEDKSLIENLWRREIVAGLVGAFFVFILLLVYYLLNGLFRKTKVLRRIN